MNIERISNLGWQRWFNELAGQGIFLTDAELKICGWNRWLEQHSGRSAKEMQGQPLLEAFPELRSRGVEETYRAVLMGEARVLAQQFHKYLLPLSPTLEGAGFTNMQQSARISPLRDEAGIIGTLTVIEDVTERVVREQTLRHQLDEIEASLGREQMLRAKAEESNHLKDEFIATVSHELRTPLNHMLGWVSLLRSGQVSPEKTSDALAIIERNVRAQNSLVEDLLDTTRILTGHLRFDLYPVKLSSIVLQAVAAVQPQAEKKNIRLQTSCAPGEYTVTGDASRLQQIVANLLSNAVKFTDSGGNIEVALRSNALRAELMVSDTGCGIQPDFLPYVFDRFRQQDGRRARRAGGLGLGLSIVKHLVELHGGTITASSAGPAMGTTFTVTIPLRNSVNGQENLERDKELSRTLKSDSAAHFPQSLFLQGLSIMVVDDEPETLTLLTSILEPAGAEVMQAENAEQALVLWRHKSPDILVSDIGMPEVDGYEMLRLVREFEKEANLSHRPAIALTAYANGQERLRALSAGYQMHLAKPVEPLELLTVIASLTGRLYSEKPV